jgi:formamidopyrimidine-DNA glycosylase
MPELPDIEVYIDCLKPRILGEVLTRVRVASPFLVRTFDPPIAQAAGRRVVALKRVGKRVAIGLEGDLWLVLHLMIAGRLHWREADAKLAGKYALAAFDFPKGALVLTEAGAKRRASLHVVAGEAGLAALDPGGIEPLDCGERAFVAAILASGHTLKRALADPHLFSGVGNAYSDEILHAAKLSPVRLARTLSEDEAAALHRATIETLRDWTKRLRAEAGEGFPEKVTAFRKGFAVHGRYREPCPRCGAPVQRIVHGDNETNYCAACQTGGRLLMDRALSALLKKDWPRTLEEMEALRERAAGTANPVAPSRADVPRSVRSGGRGGKGR